MLSPAEDLDLQLAVPPTPQPLKPSCAPSGRKREHQGQSDVGEGAEHHRAFMTVDRIVAFLIHFPVDCNGLSMNRFVWKLLLRNTDLRAETETFDGMAQEGFETYVIVT